MNVFDTLVERGFIATNPDGTPKQVTDVAVRDLLGKEKISAYIGFDPTAASFHVGNLLPIMSLAHLQRAGHRPIVIMGGGTGMVGDPSGKSELRKVLTVETIRQNLESQKKQFSRFIAFGDDQAIILDNAEWLVPLNYIEFLREVGRHFSVNRMLTADSVKLRLNSEQGLSFLEFNYMVLQAYDFLHLFRKYGCTMQMGGDDQWGNICAGIELIRRIEGKSAYGFTYPLVTTASGGKMGKTEQGAVWLAADLLSPYEYYQFWRNADDRDVQRFLALFTFLPMDEIRRLGGLQGAKINEAKEVLAFEATKLNHGEKAALAAQEDARKAFQQGQGGDSMPTIEVAGDRLEQGIGVIALFHESGLAKSKSEARRLIEEKGGAYINGEKVTTIERKVTSGDLKNNEIMLRSGKKSYARVVRK
jgi:tyrosyl-tRNA synthetase